MSLTMSLISIEGSRGMVSPEETGYNTDITYPILAAIKESPFEAYQKRHE